jgi:hopanoid biosynthesis associated radical SAM protein HpnH
MRRFFDQLMDLGVEGMMISPGYAYDKAPDQEGFLDREQTKQLFSRILAQPNSRWRFNQTPIFLQFLQGKFPLDCTPWGTPTYNVFGWQRPCYLLDEGYCESFEELMETTQWERYGHASGNAKCRECMVHCGFEPSAMEATLGSWHGLAATIRLMLPTFRRSPDRPGKRREHSAETIA